MNEGVEHKVGLGTVLREWGRIGVTGFGGPPAHIALLRKLCVDQRGWLDAAEFEDAIAACNLLPGPGVDRARDLLRVAGARQARRRGGRAGLHRAGADPHLGPRGAVPGRHAAAVGPRRGRGGGRRRGGGGGAGGVVAARAELEARVRTGAGPGLARALGRVPAGRRGRGGDDRALARPGPARVRRVRARAAGAALARRLLLVLRRCSRPRWAGGSWPRSRGWRSRWGRCRSAAVS